MPDADRPSAFWNEALAPYAQPSLRRSIGCLLTSVLPYAGLLVAMYFTLRFSLALTLALGVLAAGFLLRTYIVFHDCAHGSFLPTKRANVWLGSVLGVLVFAPFANWRHNHAVHHATASDLDRRGQGDVPTLTVAEYQPRDWRGRLGYRLFRNPVVMFGLGPLFAMILGPRIVPRDARPRIRRSVHATNVALAVADQRRLPAARLARLPPDPGPGGADRRLGRDLAVLRPAPVRGHLLGAQRRLDLRRRRAARQLVPEAAEGAAVLHRQHRPAPRPPPQRADPQLQPPGRARRESDVPQRADAVDLGRAARRRG